MLKLRRIKRDGGVCSVPDHPLPYGVTHIRQYVGEMSFELAKMAREQGDEKLACLLEVASDVAKQMSQHRS